MPAVNITGPIRAIWCGPFGPRPASGIRLIKSVAPFFVVLFLAACASGGPAPSPSDQILASFSPGGIANQIQINAVNRLPLRSAELVAPDGRSTPAQSLTATPAPTSTVSQQYPNDVYSAGNFGAANIGSNALAPGIVGASPNSQTKLLAVISSASIQLPDPVAYRRDWQKYRIRLGFGDTPPLEIREITAPAPLPQ
jgi:hypothetical protein